MSFLRKIRAAMARFMMGRNGVDELNTAIILTAIVFMLLSSLTGLRVLALFGWAGYFYWFYRAFSRNLNKRTSENYRFIENKNRVFRSISQFFARIKNIKKYKYFKCPECGARLRLPRKVGNVTVTCGKCKHKFEKKA